MRLTREVVTKAFNLGKYLPTLSAYDLAKILNVPVVVVLEVIEKNKNSFIFDQQKNIGHITAGNSSQTLGSNEVWAWYLKNKLGGNENRCLNLTDPTSITGKSNSRIRWSATFAQVVAAHATMDKDGIDVKEMVAKKYNDQLSKRVVPLGLADGQGQIPDKYLFGIIPTSEEIKNRSLCGIPIFSAEWAMEEMLSAADWSVVEFTPGHTWVKTVEMTAGLPTPEEIEGQRQEAANDGQAGSPAAEENGKRTVNRRTKAQLDEIRKGWVTELRSILPNKWGDITQILTLEKFVDAEKLYNELWKTAQTEVGPSVTAVAEIPGQQKLEGTVPPPPAKPVDLDKPMVVAPPSSPTSTRKGMTTVLNLGDKPEAEALKNVHDLKKDIIAKAGGVTPPPVAPPQPTMPPMASLPQTPSSIPAPVNPSMPASAPPVVKVNPAGASASAEDLLNNLLKSTGQIG